MHSSKFLILFALPAFFAGTGLSASTVDDTNRVFTCTFFDNGDSSWDATGTADWSPGMRSAAMRAIETISNTLLNDPGRKLNVTFAVVEGLAVTSVMDAMPFKSSVYTPHGVETTKETWTDSDFGGAFAGQKAYVDNVEDVWRYGSNLLNSGADLVVRVNKTFFDNDAFYFENDIGGLTDDKFDFESLLLHELGHPIGFYAMNDAEESGKTAFEQLIEEKYLASRGKDVPFFTGDATMQYLEEQGDDVVSGAGNKEFYTEYGLASLGVSVSANAFTNVLDSHISQELGYENLLMGPEANYGVANRDFSELEKYMLADMGWTVAGIEVKSNAAIPEPSLFGAFVGIAVLVFAGTRRRRKAARMR